MRAIHWRSIGAATLVALLLALPASADVAAQRCAAAKIRAASRKASGKLACYRQAALRGVPVEPSCLTRPEQKFAAAFAAAERRPGCLTPGDAAMIEATVDAFVTTLASDLPGTTTTTVTTTTSSTNSTAGTCSFGNGCTGTCPGGFCTVFVPCSGFCQATTVPPACVCAAVTFTTCTVPVCVTTTSIP
jgi:hypothetical protein